LETFGALDVNEVSVVEIAYWKMLVTSCLCLPYAFLTEGSDRMAGWVAKPEETMSCATNLRMLTE